MIMQHLPVLLSSNVGLGMERLLWRVMHHLGYLGYGSRQRPAFLLLNMFRWALGVPDCLCVVVLQAGMAAAACSVCWARLTAAASSAAALC